MGEKAANKLQKEKESNELNKQVLAFIASDGVIEQIPNYIGKGVYRQKLSKKEYRK